MATSSVSTTGLVTVNTPEAYNFWGQLILLIGFQVGGLGYMTFGSFVIFASRGKMSESRIKIGKAVFSMPDCFEPVPFLKRAVVFSLLVEGLGATFLYFLFKSDGVESALWPAVFHSVSAFCTAGFSVFPNSLEDFSSNYGVNVVITLLSLGGALGFIVVSDFWLRLKKKDHKLTLTSKIILVATFGGILLGTIFLYQDGALKSLPTDERILVSFFQAMSSLTTVGFNSVSIGSLSFASLSGVVMLMIMGASPSGTGGGLKSTSWSAGLAAIWSSLKGEKQTSFFGYTIPHYRVQAAFASFTLYLLVFSLGSMALLSYNNLPFEDVVFEVASGLGTVGLSRGITGDLSAVGKGIMIGLMFIGRVGVISLGLAVLFQPKKKLDCYHEVEDISL